MSQENPLPRTSEQSVLRELDAQRIPNMTLRRLFVDLGHYFDNKLANQIVSDLTVRSLREIMSHTFALILTVPADFELTTLDVRQFSTLASNCLEPVVVTTKRKPNRPWSKEPVFEWRCQTTPEHSPAVREYLAYLNALLERVLLVQNHQLILSIIKDADDNS